MSDESLTIADVEQEQAEVFVLSNAHGNCQRQAHLDRDCTTFARTDREPKSFDPAVLHPDKAVCDRCTGRWEPGRVSRPDAYLANRIRKMTTEEKRAWFDE